LIATRSPRRSDNVGCDMGNKPNHRKRAGACVVLKRSDHLERCGRIQIKNHGLDSPFSRVRLESSQEFGPAHDVNSHAGLPRSLADLHSKEEIVHNSDHSQVRQPF
jgi:hypothetical protein